MPPETDRALGGPMTPVQNTSDPNPNPFPAAKAVKRRRARQGFNIQQRGERWIARVTDPHTYGREAKTFDSKFDAETWAQTRRAQFRLAQATASKTPFETVAAE